MQFVKHRNDQDTKWMEGNRRFEEMDRESAEFIKTVTGADIRFDGEGEVVNMWVAWENRVKQAENNGFNNGFNNGKAEGRDTTMVNCIRNLMETFGLDVQKSMDALQIPASEQEKYAKQIM